MLHPDTPIQTPDGGLKHASEFVVGDRIYVVGDEGLAVRDVSGVYEVDPTPLVTVSSLQRTITVTPQTLLLMLRRGETPVYPPKQWWTEWHPVSDLLEVCKQGDACSITNCWCLKHKRHFVTLHHLDQVPSIREPLEPGKLMTKLPHALGVEDVEAARFQHIGMGHVVGLPKRKIDGSYEFTLAETNNRARQIRTWNILPTLPDDHFSVERVQSITPADAGPTLIIDAESDPIIAGAIVVALTAPPD